MSRTLVLVFLLAACDSPVKPYAPQLDVFCVLRTDDPHPVALIGRSVSYEDWDRADDWNGVDSATVVIAQGKDSTCFRGLPESAGYYRSDSLSVVAGRSYWLTVRTPDGDEVRGSTTVPGSLAIRSVNTTVDSGRMRLKVVWSLSPGAAGYLLIASSFYIHTDGDTFCNRQSVASDSAAAQFWTASRWNGIALASVELCVAALDRNYGDYLTLRNTYGYRNTLMHIEGGLGVFGSICVAETTIYLIPPVLSTTPARVVQPTQ